MKQVVVLGTVLLFLSTGFADEIIGDNANNILNGTKRADKIVGKGGRDLIRAAQGADRAFGGGGNDEIYGEGGPDYIVGGGGSDYMEGGVGANIYFKNKNHGNDVIFNTVNQPRTVTKTVRRADGTLAQERVRLIEYSYLRCPSDLKIKKVEFTHLTRTTDLASSPLHVAYYSTRMKLFFNDGTTLVARQGLGSKLTRNKTFKEVARIRQNPLSDERYVVTDRDNYQTEIFLLEPFQPLKGTPEYIAKTKELNRKIALRNCVGHDFIQLFWGGIKDGQYTFLPSRTNAEKIIVKPNPKGPMPTREERLSSQSTDGSAGLELTSFIPPDGGSAEDR